MTNPYTPFTPAFENFFGREDILEAFGQRLKPGSNACRLARHFLLVGDGGVGKTSLIEQMKRRVAACQPDAHIVTIDVGNYAFDLAGLIDDLHDQVPQPRRLGGRKKAQLALPSEGSEQPLLDRLIQGLRNGVALGFPPSIEVAPGAFLRDPESPMGAARRIALWCGQVLQLCAESDDLLIVLIDQMGKLSEIPGGLLVVQGLAELMENGVNYRLGNLLFVMAIRPERKGSLEHRFRQEVFHPRWVTRRPVYPLDDEAARKAIFEPARSNGVYLETACVDAFRRRCGNHPYHLQIACYRLWDYLADAGRLYEVPVKLSESEIDQVVRKAQGAMFRDFSLEEQYVLKILALSRIPQTRMQIKDRIQESGGSHLMSVDSVLEGLIRHKHRPIKYHEFARAFAIAHDLFAEYISRTECSERQRELAGLQTVLDYAPVSFEITGDVLTEPQLEQIWRTREQLMWRDDCIATVIASEVAASGYAGRWAEWFLSSRQVAMRLAAAEAIGGTVSERVWALLRSLQKDADKSVRQAADEALSRSSIPTKPWGWDDDWDYAASTM